MHRLTDDNPYEILGIDQNADRNAIKKAHAERTRALQDKGEKQRSLDARKRLFDLEARMVVDALTPDFLGDYDAAQVIEAFRGQIAGPVDWLSYLDTDAILAQDLQALIEATLRYALGDLPEPEPADIAPVADFDGLEEFLRAWLG